MGVARAVDHPAPRLRHERPGQHVAHPVAALYPAPVVAVARGLESRPHREQILYRDPRPRRVVEIFWKKLVNRGLDAVEMPLVERDTDQHRDDALGRRLEIGGPVRRGAVEILLGDPLAVDRHQHRPHPRQLGHARKCRLEHRRRLDRGKRAGGEAPAGQRGHDAHSQQRETQPVAARGVSHEAQAFRPARQG